MSVIDTLIANRTGGYYGAEDLNRVGKAFKYLQNSLNNQYGFNISLAIKTDWKMTDEPTQAQMSAYLNNVAAIRSAINTATSPPTNMEGLTAKEANDIEKVLQEVENTLTVIQLSWIGSGEIGSGEI